MILDNRSRFEFDKSLW